MVARWAIVILVSGALLGAVVASAAGLSVGGVDELGSGTADVNPPCAVGTVPCPATDDVVVSDVEWFLDLGGACGGDSSKVSHVRVTIESVANTTSFDIIRFQISGVGGVLANSGTAFDGSQIDGFPEIFTWDLNAGTTVPSGCVSAADITDFSATVVDEAP